MSSCRDDAEREERAGEWLGERERRGPTRGDRRVVVEVELPVLGRRIVRVEDGEESMVDVDDEATYDDNKSTARFGLLLTDSD